MISATLESAYLAQNASMNAAPVTYTPSNAMTPEVKEANSSELDIINQGGQGPAGTGGTISLGMSIAEVETALGRPRNTVDLGAKTIYLYKDLKVTFLKGRVSDVQ
jgi:hypothetical protein